MSRVLAPVLAALSLSLLPSTALAIDFRFSGFGDVTLGTRLGDTVNNGDLENFEDYGEDSIVVNENQGFGTGGTDFVVLADLTNRLTYLAEVNFQTLRGQSTEFEIDVERILVDYRFNQAFNVQAGLFFTPIGLYNRFLYSRAWLVNSVRVPDLFEEEYGFLPTHSTGLEVHGGFPMLNGSTINYAVSIANGRADAPDGIYYTRAPEPPQEISGLVEMLIPGFKVSRVGISGWTDVLETVNLDTPGETVLADEAEALNLREVGIDGYVSAEGRYVSVFAEYIQANRFEVGDSSELDVQHMLLAELSFHILERKLHPYARYDLIVLPEDGGGDYLWVRGDGDTYTAAYIPDFNGFMIGAAYDAHRHARIKLEYGHNLDGPRPMHAVTGQVAYGF